ARQVLRLGLDSHVVYSPRRYHWVRHPALDTAIVPHGARVTDTGSRVGRSAVLDGCGGGPLRLGQGLHGRDGEVVVLGDLGGRPGRPDRGERTAGDVEGDGEGLGVADGAPHVGGADVDTADD